MGIKQIIGIILSSIILIILLAYGFCVGYKKEATIITIIAIISISITVLFKVGVL